MTKEQLFAANEAESDINRINNHISRWENNYSVKPGSTGFIEGLDLPIPISMFDKIKELVLIEYVRLGTEAKEKFEAL